MSSETPTPSNEPIQEFERQANASQRGLVAEFIDFLRTNATWWIAPIVIVLLLFGVLLLLQGTALAPFIYPLF